MWAERGRGLYHWPVFSSFSVSRELTGKGLIRESAIFIIPSQCCLPCVAKGDGTVADLRAPMALRTPSPGRGLSRPGTDSCP